MIDLGETLGSAGKVFWKFKILWLVGILPMLIYGLPGIALFALASPFPSSFTDQTPETTLAYSAIMTTVVYLVLMVIYLVMTVLASAALVAGTQQADSGEGALGFTLLLRESLPYFWKLLGLYALLGAALLAALVLLSGCVFLTMMATMGLAVFCIFPLYFLLLPGFMLASVLLEQAKAAIVIDRLGVIDGLKRAWGMVRTRFWSVVLMAIILYVGSYLISILLAVPLYAVMFIPMMGMVNGDFHSMERSFSTMMWVMVVAMPFYLVLQGIAPDLIRISWSVTYLRLRSPQPADLALPGTPANVQPNHP